MKLCILLLFILYPLAAFSEQPQSSKAPFYNAERLKESSGADPKNVNRGGSGHIPGERIIRGGKEYRVWSTEGPVPVSPPPEPFATSGYRMPVGEGVIVDLRKGSDK